MPPPPLPPLQDDEINVVTDYKPGVATGAARALPTMVIDPITGQTVAASDLSDHMRIQLMDPKWREEQARAAAKQKDTALAEGDSIAASLKSLARKRGDIFGSAEVSKQASPLLFSPLPLCSITVCMHPCIPLWAAM